MVIGIELPNRTNRAQLFLIIGTGIFFTRAIGLITGYLSHGQTSVLCALSLILTGAGSSVKRGKGMKIKNSKNGT